MKKTLEEFKAFALRGNVVDMAVGIIIGAAFGKIVDGLDIVNKIADVPTDYMDRPLEDQRIKTVTVDTKGVEYDEPEKM